MKEQLQLMIYKDKNGKVAPMIVQILILSIIMVVGQVLCDLIPFNISAPVIDFLLIYLLLQLHIIKLNWIDKISSILSQCMLISFVPGTVGIINNFNELLNMIFPSILASTIGTIIVIFVSGGVTSLFIKVIDILKYKMEAKKDE